MTKKETVGSVQEILWIERVVSKLELVKLFYEEVLEFKGISANETELSDDLIDRHIKQSAFLSLGNQKIRLVEYSRKGKLYPEDSHSADLWFQHFAIVTSDIGWVYRKLSRHNALSISEGGPQKLPPSTGSVIAYKFRDPDRHPLELLAFPEGPHGGSEKHSMHVSACLGIDHSAICISDSEVSIHFYTQILGMEKSAQQINKGREQELLDGLKDDIVDVITLLPRERETPHLELLCYHHPRGRQFKKTAEACDIASDKIIFRVDDVKAVLSKIEPSMVVLTQETDQRLQALVCDPDGHFLILTEM